MLKFKKVDNNGISLTMYTSGDHLWISDVMPNCQHILNQLKYDKMISIQAKYTTDEIESLFNVSSAILK